VVATIEITSPRTVVEPGESAQLVARALTANGVSVPGVTFAWSTTDTALVSVSTAGVVTGIAKGDAAIVATATGPSTNVKTPVTASMQLGVRQVVRKLTISAPDTISVGDTAAVKVVAYDAIGVVIPNAAVTWSTSDSLLASVNGGQSVVGEDYGTATLSALVTGPSDALAGLSSAPIATKRIAVRLLFTQIAAGSFHTCGVARNGVTHCWGQGAWGRLGTGVAYQPWKSVSEPATALSDVRFASVEGDEQQDSRSGHSCGIALDRSVYCWGSGSWGMLGDGKHGENFPVYANAFPTRVAGVPAAKQVGLGAMHTCILDIAGSAWCAGGNYSGQAGVSRTGTDCAGEPCVLSFTRVGTSQTFQSLVSGGYFNCGLTLSGQAWCWGMDVVSFYDLPSPEIPTLVPAPVTFRALSAGEMHMCGLTSDGTAYCWGHSSYGQTGIGPIKTYPYWPPGPTRVVTLEHFASIYAGENHTCALTADGRAFCWGVNDYGQLASTTTESCGSRSSDPNVVVSSCTSVPVAANTTLRFVSLAVGWGHTCGLTASGELYCWGLNDSGQLGTGDTDNRFTPTRVRSVR
jgi:alpha-tubulin suppressor-like RCC1 family protein